MILGISSFTYGWAIGMEGSQPRQPMDEISLLHMARQLGLGCLQIGDNLPLHLLSKERAEDFRDALGRSGIRLELGARGMTPVHLELYVGLAAFFGAPLLRFVIDGDGYTPGTDAILGVLKEAAPALEKQGVTLGIENHDRLRSRELARIIEAAASDHIGICLDCVNSIGAGEGLEQVADNLAPHTVNLHLKDFAATRLPHKMGFTITGAPVGEGLLDIEFLMNKLSGYGKCRSAVLEQWVPPEATLEASVAKEKNWAEHGVAYLKRLGYFA